VSTRYIAVELGTDWEMIGRCLEFKFSMDELWDILKSRKCAEYPYWTPGIKEDEEPLS
jgi:hypothetical protein